MDAVLNIKKVVFNFFLLLTVLPFCHADDLMDEDREFFNKIIQRFERDFREAEKRMDQMFKHQSLDFMVPKDLITGFGLEKFWKEEKDRKVLVIKALPVEDRPLDIRVKDDVLTIKGHFIKKNKDENSYSEVISSFEESLSLPDDVVGDKMQIEPKAQSEQLWLIFPKKASHPEDRQKDKTVI